MTSTLIPETHPNANLIDLFAKARDAAAEEGNKGHIIHNARMVKLLKSLPKINSLDDLNDHKGVGPKSRIAIAEALGFPLPEKKLAGKKKKRADADNVQADDDDGAVQKTKKAKKTEAESVPKTDAPTVALPSLLLAQSFEPEKHDATGWLMSEKLDGVRAYWCGKAFWSRQGNSFAAPDWFTKHLPNIPLDGELFCGRGRFEETSGVVRKHVPVDEEWQEIRYYIFDMPDGGERVFEERLELIDKHIGENHPVATVVEHLVCTGNGHVQEALDEIVKEKGEGLMLRQPGSKYEGKRSKTLLKVKKAYDAEARVVGHLDGKGRNAGRCGSLQCEMACGKQFKCGSGMSDADRDTPPPIGSIITYQFNEMTKKSGVPRFPTFMRVRNDMSEPRDFVFS